MATINFSSIPDLTLPSADELKACYVRTLMQIASNDELPLNDYGYNVELSEMDRREALKRAIASAGIVKVVAKLRYLVETNDVQFRIIEEDWNWAANQ